MKYLLFIVLAFATAKSYSQLTLNEMFAVYKMDLDKFESYAFKKGYQFSVVKDEECCFGASYEKGKGVNTKYISLYTRIYDKGKLVTYQTSIERELLTLRDQMINSGFKLSSTGNFNGALVKNYKRESWMITVYSKSDDEGSVYEISLEQER